MSDRPTEDTQSDLFKICSLSDPYQADLVKVALLDHGLKCELDNVHQGGLAGVLAIDVLILKSDLEEATDVINQHFPGLL
jgi:hypothetical protein